MTAQSASAKEIHVFFFTTDYTNDTDSSLFMSEDTNWEIYELWCFVKMKRLVREVMGCKDEDVDEDKETMLNPFTSSKVEHIVKFWYPDTNKTGDYVTLHYQHTYNRHKDEMHTATTEQRPDIVLNIERCARILR